MHEASCRLAGALRNLPTFDTMPPRRQSQLGHGLLPCKLRHATSQAEPARSRAVASQAAPCYLAGRAHSVTGCRHANCAMPPRRQSLLGHGPSPHKLRHATSQAEPARPRAVAMQTAPCHLAGRACSATGCRPIKRQTPTASYVSELPTKQREFVFLHGL